MTEAPKDWNPVWGEFKPLKSRGLTEETCKKYGYQVAEYHGKTVQVATYKRDGVVIGQKIRTKQKEFIWLGEKHPGLYGQHLWKSGGRKIVVVEGEVDCLSISQAQDNKWPCVSLPSGAQSAKRAFKDNLEYLNSFEQVIIMFDSDEPGQKAAHEVAPLLAPGKAFISELPLKDANEMLVAHRMKDLISAVWNAIPYTPEGIVNGQDLLEEMLIEPECGLTYPWPSLTKALHGIREDEVITVIAGTGIGKSQVFKEVAYHLITEHKQKVGLFFMEESNRTTALNLSGMSANKPFHLPEVESTKEEKEEHFNKVFGEGNVFLFNHFGSADFNDIVSRMRYLAVSCDVKHIFIDHLAAFVVSDDSIKDERKTLDVIISTLASLCRELNITIFLISHLNSGQSGMTHEEGAVPSLRDIRGTRGIAQWSSQVIGLSRNQQAEDPAERHITELRVLKDRFAGAVGTRFHLKYDAATGRINEVEEAPAFEPIEESINDFTDF